MDVLYSMYASVGEVANRRETKEKGSCLGVGVLVLAEPESMNPGLEETMGVGRLEERYYTVSVLVAGRTSVALVIVVAHSPRGSS